MASFSKTANQVNTAFGSKPLAYDTQTLYRMLMGSPAFQSMMQNYSLQGNQLGQNLTAGLARRGLTGTGVGTVAQSMGQSAGGFMQTQGMGDLYTQALQAAMQNLQARLGATTNIYNQQQQQGSFLGNLFGGLLGAGSTVLAGPLGAKLFK